MDDIWAIILAAGESLRMGRPKMLLPFKDKTIIEKVIDNIRSSEIDRTMVVLGAYREEIMKVIEPYSLSYCYNDIYKQGMLSSVKCGFRSLPDDFRAALIFLGDQPMIGAEIVNSLVESYNQSVAGIVIPVFNGARGHPVLIDRKYTGEIELTDSQDGLRHLISKFKDDILEVTADSSVILRDIDTEEDYRNEINQIQ